MNIIKNTSNKLNAVTISNLIKEELVSIHNQVMSNSFGFKPVSMLSLDWYEQGFSVYYKDGITEVEVECSCDTYEKHLITGEVILEFSNIELECFNVDTETESYSSLKGDSELLEVMKDLVSNANHYKLVDNHYITTDNADETYSEMSENYNKYGY